ncbi:cytidine deaminase [Paenibacillus urinalis]|uniref:Cytidine deaminase n=1 Tax=Paenibacillus urinalis TaxID=521520 RepID=A0AAX3MYQ1_9BACL|nr:MULTISPECIES: cytidine deaminase [Paenibacillus]WDH81570.1 cytidine deaminase [Paenibacillus urinalis]WDH97614.1 cytidine deaminase [Paenibacillus urinalis]WDI01287.1 cytidine deaminase [Paenibacillus urinalis]GAK39645.1 cytidine deaminase [Paenibacillus sp. TCA20]
MDAHQLMQEAIEARKKAYIPYSQFGVGAALLGEDGYIYHGCNIENAAYSPSNCAERTALFSAIANGHVPRKFKALAVVGDTEGPIAPCGVCRQVILELCDSNMPVYLGNLKGEIQETTISELLPGAFGPEALEKA